MSLDSGIKLSVKGKVKKSKGTRYFHLVYGVEGMWLVLVPAFETARFQREVGRVNIDLSRKSHIL